MAGSPDYSVKLSRGMRALWRIASTTLVGIPCLVVLLANHRGLGSKRNSGFERRLLVCSPQRSVAIRWRGECWQKKDVKKVRSRDAEDGSLRGQRSRAGKVASKRRLREGPVAPMTTTPHTRRGLSLVMASPPFQRF